MVLRMARPATRKGTSKIQFSKRIPADVKRILAKLPSSYRPKGWGSNSIRLTTGSADPKRAKMEHARIAAEVEARFATLRAGPQTLTNKQAAAIAGEIYQGFAQGGEDDPGSPEAWRRALDMNAEARAGRFGISPLLILGEGERRRRSMEDRFGDMADAALAAKGLVVDPESRAKLLEQLARATDLASAKLARNAAGDYSPDPAAQSFPNGNGNAAKATGPKLTLTALFDKWVGHPEQKDQARQTVSRYRGVFRRLEAFLNNPDARIVSREDVNRYLEARMSDGSISPRTAGSVEKAAVSSVYNWALGKGIVDRNPAEKIRIAVKRKAMTRPKEASDHEARAIADAALAIPIEAAIPGTLEAAKRWAILLCLYTGCRIGEVTQLRKKDVLSNAASPALNITPEAGAVKNKEARLVPLHPRIVELGFLAFVDQAGEGPLFYDAAAKRKVENAKTPQSELVAGDLATWARQNGLGDPRLSRPLHALRHRFMTIARLANVDDQCRHAIVGHAQKTINGGYGSYPLDLLTREVRKLDPAMVEGRAVASVHPEAERAA